MVMPGRTHKSCAVSNTRIFSSSSSNFILPLLDDEAIVLVNAHVVEFVETLLPCWNLQATGGAMNAGNGNSLINRSLFVPPLAVFDFRLEIVADDSKSCLLGCVDVHLTLDARGVGVIDNKWLSRFDASKG